MKVKRKKDYSMPFNKLMVLSIVEGLMALSVIDGKRRISFLVSPDTENGHIHVFSLFQYCRWD
jgi:hypothetical protein